MFRHYSRTVLLSSRFFTKNLTIAPFNKFVTFKSIKPISVNLLHNNNTFFFAQLPKHQVLHMPALSPTMTEGKIVKWNVKQGDKIDVGDTICQVETDKATVAFESTDKGFIAKIVNEQGLLAVGKPVAILAKKADDVSAFKSYQFGAQQSQPKSSPQETPKQAEQAVQKPSAPAKSYPQHGLLKLPAVSPTMTEGKIVQWKIKEGDSFDVGDSIFSIETDKATVDYEATQKGVLAKIISKSNDALPVGNPVAVFTKKKEDVQKFKDFTLEGKGSAPTQPKQTVSQPAKVETIQTQAPSQQTTSSGERVFASPIAKTLAQQKGIHLSQVQGSGPNGRILKQDVESYQPKKVETTEKPVVEAPKQASKQTTKKPKKVVIPENPFEQIPLNSMRKTIANRLTESKTTIPHYYVQVSVQMNKVNQLRQQLNKNEEGVKISINDIIVKAVALALRDVPDANTQWAGNVIKKFKHSDVSVAVATEGGLITPIVFRAETLGLLDIARKTKDIAKRAREGKLDPSEFIGGTTTVSNLGMFGIDSVTSVINPPQSTILGVGQTTKKVVFDPQAADPKVPYKVIDSMELIVSADHRVVDGALASKWLSRIKKYLEDPVTMLL